MHVHAVHAVHNVLAVGVFVQVGVADDMASVVAGVVVLACVVAGEVVHRVLLGAKVLVEHTAAVAPLLLDDVVDAADDDDGAHDAAPVVCDADVGVADTGAVHGAEHDADAGVGVEPAQALAMAQELHGDDADVDGVAAGAVHGAVHGAHDDVGANDVVAVVHAAGADADAADVVVADVAVEQVVHGDDDAAGVGHGNAAPLPHLLHHLAYAVAAYPGGPTVFYVLQLHLPPHLVHRTTQVF